MQVEGTAGYDEARDAHNSLTTDPLLHGGVIHILWNMAVWVLCGILPKKSMYGRAKIKDSAQAFTHGLILLGFLLEPQTCYGDGMREV